MRMVNKFSEARAFVVGGMLIVFFGSFNLTDIVLRCCAVSVCFQD